MISEHLKIANIKCHGCANSIETALTDINGVSSVTVIPDNDEVDVSFRSPEIRNRIVKKLAAMGYPEATEENGLLMQLKSYASCMIGRVTKKVEV
jgi:copper chaperone CopZ